MLALLLTLIVPHDSLLHDHVDTVEINHFYDERGRLVFDQCIYWDWCARECRYQVRDWRLLKTPSQVPTHDRRGGYTAVWHDGDELRKVQCHSVRESWTQWDPELHDRQVLPKNRRRELRRLEVSE